MVTKNYKTIRLILNANRIIDWLEYEAFTLINLSGIPTNYLENAKWGLIIDLADVCSPISI
jgi:hypothetical protein